jgi:phage terminase Nu1 subunit (DNA packaging protein)
MVRRTEPVAAASDQPRALSKTGLCALLSWSRPTLDQRLLTDPAFPVLKAGSKGGGWKFDGPAVVAYLASAPSGAGDRDVGRSADDAPADASGGRPRVEHTGEQTARQRRDTVQAEILEDKLRRDRGELVQVEEMRQVLNTMLAHLGKALERLPDQIVERLSLTEAIADDIRSMTDELRRSMADELRTLLERPAR